MQDALKYLSAHMASRPRVAVVLGSGLGAFADELDERQEIHYAQIPGWPESTAIGHAGKLVFGKVGATPAVVMSGRAHLYEGHAMAKVVYGVRALGRLGVKAFIFTNAAGGINLAYSQGALVLVSDHINLQGVSPLTGPNDESLGPRFPDMTDAYDAEFRRRAKAIGKRLGVDLAEGVYAGLPGPSYETPAEIRYLRAIGADLVGMSTVPEVIAARHMGIRCMAISCVTNMAAGVVDKKLDHAEVLEVGRQTRGTMVGLLRALTPAVEAAL
jgi:purine-nucleoside phosphorylase